MRKQLSRTAATIGMAVGIAVIAGSVIGGIALAIDHKPGFEPDISKVADVAGTRDGGDAKDDRNDASGNRSPSVIPPSSPSPYGDPSSHDTNGSRAEDDHEDEHEDGPAHDDGHR